MKLYSWNVNGFRAVIRKGFRDWFKACDADVVGLQEVKATEDQVVEDRLAPGYSVFWNGATVKKGYSGTACYSRVEPLSCTFGLPDTAYQGEGRVVRLEFEGFHFLNVYFPNGQMNEDRLAFKMGFYDSFLAYAEALRKEKPVVVCGDFNTAHREIDLKNPKANQKISGFLPEERAWLDRFIGHGYVDTFRMFHPEPEHYTWWSYRFGARSRNAGWRIDYFFVSEELRHAVRDSWIESSVSGSDHCPLGLELSC